MYKKSKDFYEFGPFRLDPARRLLLRQDQAVPLTPKVLHTLLVLVENRGRVVAKEELMKAVWPDTFVEEGNLTQNISVLRKTLGESPGEHAYIETIPKQGYRFIPSSATEPEPEPETKTEAAPRLSRYRSLLWAVVLPAALAIAAGLSWLYLRTPNEARALKITPLTSDSGLEMHPSFSPDANQVAFTWDGERKDNPDIYSKVIGSDRSQRLTFDPARDFRPAWSPDGRWIAFLRAKAGREISVIRISSTGGPESKVADVHPGYLAGYRHAPFLEWTPDGKFLLTVDRFPPDEATSLCIISVESGEKRRLTSPPPTSLGDLTAAISADGRTLAFSRNQSGTLGKLCTVEMPTEFTASGEPACFGISDQRLANFGSVRWVQDRHEVVFSTLFSGSGQTSLWTMALPKRQGGIGVPERVPIPSHGARDPVISRDGRRLVYSDFRVDSDVWRHELKSAKPTAQSLAPRPVRLISSTQLDRTAQYSPDGTKIAFNSTRSGHPAIWVSDSDGSNPRRLTTTEFPLVGPPRWSPDGRHLVFDSTLDGQSDLYRINADGSGLRRLTEHPEADAVPSWSRNGQWIYFVSKRSGKEEIWKLPAGGGEPVQVTTQGGDGATFESVDGRYVFYTKTVNAVTSLWRIPSIGGEEVKILNSLHRLQYAVSASGIYFVGPTGDGVSIQFHSFKTGTVTPIAPVDGSSLPGLSVSPDERFLLHSFNEIIGSDLALVENFR